MEPSTETTSIKKEEVTPQQTAEQNENDKNSQNQPKKESLEEKLKDRSTFVSSHILITHV